MKKVPAVLAVMALIALPILAAPKPTPTPAARVKSKSNITNNKEKAVSGPVRATGHEDAPTPSPTAGPVAAEDPRQHTSHSNSYKEGAPATPSPTVGPAEVNQIKGTKSNTSYKEAAPTPTPTAGDTDKRKYQTISNASKEADPGTPTVTPPLPNGSRDKLKGTSKTMFEREQMQPKYKAGRVLSQQGRRLTVQLSNGQTVQVDGSGLNPAPRVGSTVTVTESRGSWIIVTR